MKILHVVSSYLPAVRYGGTIVSVHGLCKALAARGHDVHVFTTSVDGAARFAGAARRARRSRRRLGVVLPLSLACGALLVAAARPTRSRRASANSIVVHTHAVFLWPLWAAARAARRAGVPYVLSPRGMLEKALIEQKSRVFKTAWIALIEKQNLRQRRGHSCHQRARSRRARRLGFDLPPIVEVPNGVDFATRRRSVGALDPAIRAIINGGPYVLFLGRVSWKKGLDRLIRAMPYMSPNSRWSSPETTRRAFARPLQAQADRLEVGGRVVFTGAVDGGQSALCSPARGCWCCRRTPKTSAMSWSKRWLPVAPSSSRPRSASRQRLRPPAPGWVVDGDPATLGARLAELSANGALRQAMGQRGRATAEREFSWASVAARMESAYGAYLR